MEAKGLIQDRNRCRQQCRRKHYMCQKGQQQSGVSVAKSCSAKRNNCFKPCNVMEKNGQIQERNACRQKCRKEHYYCQKGENVPADEEAIAASSDAFQLPENMWFYALIICSLIGGY